MSHKKTTLKEMKKVKKKENYCPASNMVGCARLKVKLSLRFTCTPLYEGVLGEWMYNSTHYLPRH
jgi:hypothetical protein